MPMGVVKDTELFKQLKDSGGSQPVLPTNPDVKSGQVIDSVKPGRKTGDINVPDSIRNLIGITHVDDGRGEAVALAKSLGLSSSSVSAYSKGATSTASYDERPNANPIKQAKERIGNLARSRLRKALRNITDAKLVNTTARELAGVAKDMAIVSKHMDTTDPSNPNDRPNVSFTFFAPGSKTENNYETVVAKDDF